MEKLYAKDSETILKEFQTTEKGLSDKEVEKRMESFGNNALKEKKRKGILKVFFNQFKDLLVGILNSTTPRTTVSMRTRRDSSSSAS